MLILQDALIDERARRSANQEPASRPQGSQAPGCPEEALTGCGQPSIISSLSASSTMVMRMDFVRNLLGGMVVSLITLFDFRVNYCIYL